MPKSNDFGRRAGLVIVMMLALAAARSAEAGSITLQWDRNAEPDVTGYIVYVGTQSGVYPQTVNVGDADTYTFTDAAAGQRYFFAVAAYAGELLSPLSLEVSGFSDAYPVLNNPGTQHAEVGHATSLQLAASDPLGDGVTYIAESLPPGLMLTQSIGLITGVPTTAGTYVVAVLASDGVLSDRQVFEWVITGTAGSVNTPPVLANPGSQTTTAGQHVALQLQGADTAGSALYFSATGLPAGLSVSSSTGLITGAPSAPGTYVVKASVTDGQLTAAQTFTWIIQGATPVNTAPTLNAPGDQATDVGSAVTLQLAGADADGNPLTYSATGLPPGLQINAGIGRITGTPTVAGTYLVNARVSDGSLSAQRSFTWTVRAAAPAPSTSTGKGTKGKKSRTSAANVVLTGSTAVARATPLDETTPVASSSRHTRSVAYTGGTAGTTGLAASATNVVTLPLQPLDAPATDVRAPELSILTPVSGVSVAAAAGVILSAQAEDALGVDLNGRIEWTSNVDGSLGVGAMVYVHLTPGTHTVSAKVTDARGGTRTASVTVAVTKK